MEEIIKKFQITKTIFCDMSYHQSCRENKEWSFSEIGKCFRCVHDAGKCVHRHLLPKAIYESLIRIGLRVRRSALV